MIVMKLLELTLEDPAANLALDEALLDEADQQQSPAEWLRLWEPSQPMVVIGRSSKLDLEVNLAECQRQQLPVFRRCSGGAAVVAGPGCLMYSLVLSIEIYPQLVIPSEAHLLVLQRLTAGLRKLGCPAGLDGTSDLAVEGRKFSGNSLRSKRRHILYHGTLLYDFPLPLISQLLRMPPRQPDYRAGRSHSDFVVNLDLDVASLQGMLIEQWQAEPSSDDWPQQRTEQLVGERYGELGV